MRFRRKAVEVEPEAQAEARPEMPAGPLTVAEYLDWILDRVPALEGSVQPVGDVVGLATHEEIISPVSLPTFDNSAMDGYAVHFRDAAEAAQDHPVHLPVVGEIHAGPTTIHSLDPGTAVAIMTGAAIPQGCESVVPVEWTERDGRDVVISQAPKQGQHIRRAGEEISKGDVLLEAGAKITPRTVGVLAAAGVGQVLAAPRPRVVIMSTGAELIQPGLALPADCIYESNSHLLAAAARAHGAIAYRATCDSDDPEVFAEALGDQLLRADIVVTTGGVSKGTRDVVKEVLSGLGTVDFREVKMQPGKPQGFGEIGDDSIPIFTLPGNPVSAYVSFEVFVVPALRKMVGLAQPHRVLTTARLVGSVTAKAEKQQYLRGQVSASANGLVVEPVGGPGSHLVGGLAGANALIVLGEEVTHVDQGDHVPVLLLDWQS
ncbi:MAG TPA: molybdopterin molybdotransferase MoeA [Marmoricola sp.]|nr:molybdopterin molybdotransferase MoeA [Nocardioidaceae bacterium]HRV69809.1 molybdopterin molybdotransferase MoeA [Marmoricola sp.]